MSHCSNSPLWIVVMGGVLSGVGKGTIASSIGCLLKGYGFRVSATKIDPYLNVDAGTMSPTEHGEVYVLADGGECDLDLGNYERFIGIDLRSENNITTGKVYQAVLQEERQGKYLGKTVQIIPHITDKIEDLILTSAQTEVVDACGKKGLPEIVILELGGTVGDIESEPFLYALSQFGNRTGARVCFVHVGLIVNNNNEYKTKPYKRSVSDIRQRGINPDIFIIRCDTDNAETHAAIKRKLSFDRSIPTESIIVSGKVRNIYDVPQLLHDQHVTDLVCRKLDVLLRGTLQPNFQAYNRILQYWDDCHTFPEVRVAIVGKYTNNPDTYLSLTRALEHAAIASSLRIHYECIDAEQVEKDITLLKSFDRILVPGGFGKRGIEGKMCAIRYARENRLPYFGICLGVQLFIIEHYRNVLGLKETNSTEFDPDTPYPIVQHLSSYGEDLIEQMGGTMRLGEQGMRIEPNTLTAVAYALPEESIVHERHRHRYEISTYFKEQHPSALTIAAWGVGSARIPEIIEYSGPNAWWAIGCQFHPEYVSRNDRPHPLFLAFLKATVGNE